jgi:predicted ATPase
LAAVRGLGDIKFATVTTLVGDNGSGKSTVIEALAVAAGFNPEGGSRNLNFTTHDTHSALHEHLRLEWNGRPRWGWFLRAETFSGMATHIENDNDPRFGVAGMFPDLHNRSHGESFLELAIARFDGPGFYLLDEPEAALSVTGQLALLAIMHRACSRGAQFLLSTHSPLLMAYPGAAIYELSSVAAPTARTFDEVESVQLWRLFLDNPTPFFDELFSDSDDDTDGSTESEGPAYP